MDYEQVSPYVRRVAVPTGHLYQVRTHDQNESVWSGPVFVPDMGQAMDSMMSVVNEILSEQLRQLSALDESQEKGEITLH
jgi:hypothetical protein